MPRTQISRHKSSGSRPLRRLPALALALGALVGWRAATALGQEPMGDMRGELVIPYEQRMAGLEAERSEQQGRFPNEVPPGFEPWWSSQVVRSFDAPARPVKVDVEGLVVGAMRYSPAVLALSDIPEIHRTAILEAQAAFDVRTFMEGKSISTSDPVGSTLTTGGPPRYKDYNLYSSAGVRRRTLSGGQVELSQRFGFQDNNSIYFLPDPQGTSKLALSFTQPLLNGAGRRYNESIVVLAEVDADMAVDEFGTGLQEHLFDVNRAYWNLYLERVALLQKRRLYQRAADIVDILSARQKLDASPNQLVRAQSALATRRASLVRAGTAVRNAEAKLRLLVNDPALQASQRQELLPSQPPHRDYRRVGARDSLLAALHHRPEVDRAFQEIRAASIRADVATRDLLPVLNAVITGYLSGLAGDGLTAQAFANQFTVGGPSYAMGMVFEMPWGNRAANARQQRRRLELQQVTRRLQQTVASVATEVEIAVREVDTAYRDVQGKYRAMIAATAEIDYLQNRWKLLPGEDQVAGIVMEDLLAAQQRLAEAEYAFASAEVEYNLALADLRRATGTLVQWREAAFPETRNVPPQPAREAPPQRAKPESLPTPVAPESLPAPKVPSPAPDSSTKTLVPNSVQRPSGPQIRPLPKVR